MAGSTEGLQVALSIHATQMQGHDVIELCSGCGSALCCAVSAQGLAIQQSGIASLHRSAGHALRAGGDGLALGLHPA